MKMTLTEATRAKLAAVADEVFEVFSERGHHIHGALAQDSAFTLDRRPASALRRSMVMDAVRAGAALAGLGIEPKAGGALELLDIDDNYVLHFRLRSARRDEDGSPHVITTADPNEAYGEHGVNADGSFFLDAPWVLAYVASEREGLSEMFVAPVVGVTDNAVSELILGPEIRWAPGGAPGNPPGRGFEPADDDYLSGLDDLDEGDTGVSAS